MNVGVLFFFQFPPNAFENKVASRVKQSLEYL